MTLQKLATAVTTALTAALLFPAQAHSQSLEFGSLGSSQEEPPYVEPSWTDQPIPFALTAVKHWRGEGGRTMCWLSASYGLSYIAPSGAGWTPFRDLPRGELWAVNETTEQGQFISENYAFPQNTSFTTLFYYWNPTGAFPPGESTTLRLEVRGANDEVTELGSVPLEIPETCPITDQESIDEFGADGRGYQSAKLTPDGLTLSRD